ncbi:NAD(P)-binding protein [Paenibacillus hexagrammi]|uniref:NAD(P)-binding protein n=1 Tax=Paenibacillus hexagrammi TaxID=2908839 RepID=A0ABY3SEV7_9BACL|nr:NAD(P)-binding protein [Paenibacillus sp. YPD9-1]UJF32528.1 NAD(P)-binding protein [Paenibacillus sp. YPD9-1]
MNIAIMGAGLSGLACAITLEKHGITPSIFEKRSKIGDRFVNGEILLNIFTRPVHDGIASLSEKHGIFLHPTSSIQSLTLFSQHERAVIEGQLGFTNVRGREEDSYEFQLSRQVKAPISFNSDKTYEQLLKDFTHVVMATGDGEYAKQTRNFREDLSVSMKGATVEGSFDRYTVMAWMDYEIAPYGYGYVIPYSEKKPILSSLFPTAPSPRIYLSKISGCDFIKKLWQHSTKISMLPMSFRFQTILLRICRSARLANTFYTGNCFGSMMPFMGFGQYVALLTGIYAAYDLCGLGRYEELTKPLRQSYENSLVLRRAMEQLDNNDLDWVVSWLQSYIGEKLFQSKAINPLRIASYMLRPYIKLKQGVTT